MSMYASLGHVATLEVPATTNQAILALHPQVGIYPRFLEYWLSAMQPLLRREANSNTQDNLNAEKVANLSATRPPLDEQSHIAAFLDYETTRIDELVREQERLVALVTSRVKLATRSAVLRGLDPAAELVASGLAWYGQVPSHWKRLKIGRDLKYTIGWTPPTSNQDNFDGTVPWVNISDLGPKYLSETAKGISLAAFHERGVGLLPKGTLLMSFKLSVGLVSILHVEAVTNEAIAAFRGSDCVSIEFLYYALPIAVPEYGRDNIYGAKLLNQDLINSATTMVPGPDEQRRIVDYLDALHAEHRQLLSESRVFVSLLLERRAALITAAVTGQIDVRSGRPPNDWLAPEVA